VLRKGRDGTKVAVKALTEELTLWFILFRKIGLKAHSRSWADYERGKQEIRDNAPARYEEGIRKLARYLCL